MQSSILKISTLVVLASQIQSTLATPPACLLACVGQVTKKSDCSGLNDLTCICSSEASDVEKCLNSACPDGDADTAISAFKSSCDGYASASSSQAASSSTEASSSSKASSTEASSTEASSTEISSTEATTEESTSSTKASSTEATTEESTTEAASSTKAATSSEAATSEAVTTEAASSTAASSSASSSSHVITQSQGAAAIRNAGVGAAFIGLIGALL